MKTSEIARKYGDFDILIGMTGNKSTLKHMYSDGGIETIDECVVIGTGEPVGRFFLNKYWRRDMKMKKVAELGYFIIKAIMEYKLEYTVGLADATENKFQSKPRIHFIPDNEKDYLAPDSEPHHCYRRHLLMHNNKSHDLLSIKG